MPTRYEVYLCRDTGERLLLLSEYLELQYQIVQHEAGYCHIVLPGTFDPIYLKPDFKIAIWRQPEGGTLALEDVYLIRYIRRYTTSEGAHRYEIVGANGNSIIEDHSPYAHPTPYYYIGYPVSDHADDAMKAIIRDNLQYNTSPPFIPAAQFSVAADAHLGASFKKYIKNRSLAAEVTAWADTSTGRGVTILWHVVAISEAEYQFRTYVDQIGQDRSWPDGYNPILATEENGMMGEAEYVFDAIDSRNAIIAVGGADGERYAAGEWVTAYASGFYYDRAAGAYNTLSAYSHRSGLVDCGNELDYDVLDEEALEELEARRPKETLTFKLKETATQRYGRDWRFGDKITAFYEKYFTCRIRAVTVSKNSADEPEEIKVDMDIVPVRDIIEG
jgi:hypothetical protein